MTENDIKYLESFSLETFEGVREGMYLTIQGNHYQRLIDVLQELGYITIEEKDGEQYAQLTKTGADWFTMRAL